MSNINDTKKYIPTEKEKKLDKANKQTNKLDNTTKDINQILDNIKLLSQTSHIKKYCESLILRAS